MFSTVVKSFLDPFNVDSPTHLLELCIQDPLKYAIRLLQIKHVIVDGAFVEPHYTKMFAEVENKLTRSLHAKRQRKYVLTEIEKVFDGKMQIVYNKRNTVRITVQDWDPVVSWLLQYQIEKKCQFTLSTLDTAFIHSRGNEINWIKKLIQCHELRNNIGNWEHERLHLQEWKRRQSCYTTNQEHRIEVFQFCKDNNLI